MKAFNAHKSAWMEMSLKKSPIEERTIALEQVVKKNLADPVRNAASGVATGMPQIRTYASVVVQQISKTAVRVRIDGADKLWPEELLSRAKEHIDGAYAVRLMRSNDTENYVQSASQRDAAQNMR